MSDKKHLKKHYLNESKMPSKEGDNDVFDRIWSSLAENGDNDTSDEVKNW